MRFQTRYFSCSNPLGVNKMKKIFYIIISTFIISCSTSEKIKLESNKTIVEFFNDSEIKDLQLLLDYFNQEICDSQHPDLDVLNQCYEKYCERINEETNEGGIGAYNPKIEYKGQSKIYETINNSSFNKIWEIRKVYNNISKQYEKDLELNFQGKIFRFY